MESVNWAPTLGLIFVLLIWLHNFQEEQSVWALIYSFKTHLLRPCAKSWRWIWLNFCLQKLSEWKQPYSDDFSSIICGNKKLETNQMCLSIKERVEK